MLHSFQCPVDLVWVKIVKVKNNESLFVTFFSYSRPNVETYDIDVLRK